MGKAPTGHRKATLLHARHPASSSVARDWTRRRRRPHTNDALLCDPPLRDPAGGAPRASVRVTENVVEALDGPVERSMRDRVSDPATEHMGPRHRDYCARDDGDDVVPVLAEHLAMVPAARFDHRTLPLL